jgi:hypothetical protein
MKIGKAPTAVIAILMCLLLAGSTLAIEKRKKDDPPAKPDTTAASTSKLAPDTTKLQVKPPTAIKKPPIFNDFIDVNRNGIDDRLEQGKNLLPPKQAPAIRTPDTVKAKPAAGAAAPVKEKPKKKD